MLQMRRCLAPAGRARSIAPSAHEPWLGRTLFSDYWRLRARIGLAQYSEAAMLEKLKAAGFDARRAGKNIGHDQARMAFIARPR